MASIWNRVKEANVLFSYVFTSNPLPGLNRILSTIAVCGIISFVLYAVLDDSKNEVTLLKENAPADQCTSMKSTFTCKTSDGTSYDVNADNCVGYTTDVTAWYAADQCTEFIEAAFSCRFNSATACFTSAHPNGNSVVFPYITGSNKASMQGCSNFANSCPYQECQGTINTAITFDICSGFINETIETPVSVRIAQALAYSSSLVSILGVVYGFFAKRELERRARERQENGNDSHVNIGMEAAPAQIASLENKVGNLEKSIAMFQKRMKHDNAALNKQMDDTV